MTNDQSWSVSESRRIPPFKIATDGFAGVGFRALRNDDYSTADPFRVILESGQIRSPDFRPAFKFNVDAPKLAEEAGRKPTELVVSVLLTDPAILQSRRIASWPLQGLPDTYEIAQVVLDSLSGNRGIELRLCASPAKVLRAESQKASFPGQIVCDRTFSIDTPIDGTGFPITPVPPDYFVQQKMPADTVWTIKWNNVQDFNCPAEDALTILINTEYAAKLMRLSGTDKAGSVIWSQLAAEIALEIALVVFGSEPDAPNSDKGLLSTLVTKLQGKPRLSVTELNKKAALDGEGISFFRSRLQSAFGLGTKIQNIPLGGRG
jgi:hypothetical protein